MRCALSLIILALIGITATPAQVKVWEGTMPLASSDEGPPDENPNFDTFANVEDYPYTMRQDIRATETVHPWHALYLENEYLKCTILPQLGGHIYTCIDKINGKPMFYANPSLKRATIAYRGAWSAFGEEFDFPVSHNWVTISPVDWSYSTAADGSASVTVGNRDRVYGMDWTVEIVLRPGSTLLEEHVTLSNHSDARHHFFWWNNAGIEVWNDSRMYYPMQFTVDNGSASIDTWPVNLAGKNLSLVSTQTGDFEVFAYGSSEAFMGLYSPHTNSGVVHWADPSAVPAKKLFSWGNDGNALDWSNRLSDNKSTYVELQSGLFRDQTTYEFLEPRQSRRFTEFWMPVRGIGSIARANLNGVLTMERTRQKDGKITLKLGFNANRAIPGARITVSDGEKNALEEDASLDPTVIWSHQIVDLPADKTYAFQLASAQGETLLKHVEGVYDILPRNSNRLGLYADSLELLSRNYPTVVPEEAEPGAPSPSADPLLAYYRGFCHEKLGQSGAADYLAASQMPLLYIFPSEPDEINVLHAALAANASDASAHFLLGTLLFSKGIVDPALEKWKLAESLNPKIPSLQVNMGRVHSR